jgi:hypothetical protein
MSASALRFSILLVGPNSHGSHQREGQECNKSKTVASAIYLFFVKSGSTQQPSARVRSMNPLNRLNAVSFSLRKGFSIFIVAFCSGLPMMDSLYYSLLLESIIPSSFKPHQLMGAHVA